MDRNEGLGALGTPGGAHQVALELGYLACQDVDRAVKDALAHRTDYDTEMRVPWTSRQGRAFLAR